MISNPIQPCFSNDATVQRMENCRNSLFIDSQLICTLHISLTWNTQEGCSCIIYLLVPKTTSPHWDTLWFRSYHSSKISSLACHSWCPHGLAIWLYDSVKCLSRCLTHPQSCSSRLDRGHWNCWPLTGWCPHQGGNSGGTYHSWVSRTPASYGKQIPHLMLSKCSMYVRHRFSLLGKVCKEND